MRARCQARDCDRPALTTYTDGAGRSLELCEDHGDLLAVGFPLRVSDEPLRPYMRRHLLGCNGVAWRICRPECECWCHKPVCPTCGFRTPLPPGPRQPNGNCVVTGPGSGGTPPEATS